MQTFAYTSASINNGAMQASEIIIIGAGLAGLSAAWYLNQAGFDVLVIEKDSDVAMQTSFANSGMVTPSMSDPWNAPGILKKVLGWLGDSTAPLLVRPSALPVYAGWGAGFVANSKPGPYQQAMIANCTLSTYSTAKIGELRESLNLQYDASRRGTMKVFRSQQALDAAAALHALLKEHGLNATINDVDASIALEPLLTETRHSLAGSMHYPNDETGNARLFCLGLKEHLQRAGVRFAFNTQVKSIRTQGLAIAAVHTDQGTHPCSMVVVAAASWSPRLLKPLNIRLPIRPVKGYSLSVPTNPQLQPQMSLIDDELHTAATPLGNTLRIAGTAELAGFNQTIDPKRIDNLWHFLQQLSPSLYNSIDQNKAKSWCGLRPVSAHGKPLIGPTHIKGLYLNTGHGHLGWTQSAGSGSLLAQLMQGKTPDIDPSPYAFGNHG